MKDVRIGTHDGYFHADEVFALAILRRIYPEAKFTRTRDNEKLASLDFRVDVGRRYNPRTKDFDHHQAEFTLKRKNGIPYTSAGLIWKNFGKKIAGSKESFEIIDKKLIQPIDAEDSGINIAEYKDVLPYNISDVIDSLNPTWEEPQDEVAESSAFGKAIDIASEVLEREIKKADSDAEGKKIVEKSLKKSKEQFIVLEKSGLPWKDAVIKSPEIKFVIMPSHNGNWMSLAVPLKKGVFEYKMKFPERWGGMEGELEKETNIKGARFCHKERFIVAATTKESAIELTKLALSKNNEKRSESI